MTREHATYPKVICIDLDGTLVDSVCDLHKAVNLMEAEYTLPVSSEQDIRHWIGNGIERLVHRALTKNMHSDADAELFKKVYPHFLTYYAQTNGHYSTVYPAVEEFLQWAQAQSIELVCITNKARQFAQPLLVRHRIDRYFTHLIAGDDVINKKPHAEPLLKAARQCNVEPAECLMIGDSISDIKAAKLAGFKVVCVSYGYNHGRNINHGETVADHVVDSFSELYSLIAPNV